MKSYLRDISINMIGSILGGLFLAILFFMSSDFLFKPPDLNGRWVMATTSNQTMHDAYSGLTVFYEVILHQDGNRLSGTAEKVGENNKGVPLVYDYDKRVRVDIAGAIDRNYLARDNVNIHWTEHGRRRDSTAFFKITRFDDSYMIGNCASTVAHSYGLSEWVRSASQFTIASTNVVAPVLHPDDGW